MSHDWGQSPAVSGADDRFSPFFANVEGCTEVSEAFTDVSGDCPRTRPEEAA